MDVSSKNVGNFPIETSSADDDFDQVVMHKWQRYLQTLPTSASQSIGKSSAHWRRWYNNLDLAEFEDAYNAGSGDETPMVMTKPDGECPHDLAEDASDSECPHNLEDSDDEEDIPHVRDQYLSAKQLERRELRRAREIRQRITHNERW